MRKWFRRRPRIKDALVKEFYLRYLEEYPRLAQEHLLQLAQKQAEWERDTERITLTQIREVLTSIRLSEFVIHLFDEKVNLKEYGFFDVFRSPKQFVLMTKREQDLYEVDRYVPLFETQDDFGEILAYDKETQGYIRYSPEDNFAKTDHPVLTWDGIFVGKILDWWEQEKEEEKIVNLCQLLGLINCEQILTSIKENFENSGQYSFQSIRAWKEEMINKIGGRIAD